MQSRRLASLSVLVLVAAGAASCNLIFGIQAGQPGGGGTTTTSAGFAVTPPTVTLLPNTSLAFATTGASGSVTWKLSDASAGTITSAGVFTAGIAPGPFTLTATSGGMEASATITIPAVPIGATISNPVATGALPNATGNGTQSHLAYTPGGGTAAAGWWLFHDPGTGAGAGMLAAAFSESFGTWASAGQLALPKGSTGQGVDLAVANASLGGNDVVHVSQGYGDMVPGPVGRYHIRSVLQGKQVAFGAPVSVESYASADYTGDGSSTVILSNGIVVDASGYEVTSDFCPSGYEAPDCGGGDGVAFVSDTPDDGIVPAGGLQFSATVLWCTNSIAARQLLALGETAIALYVDGGNVTPPNILMNHYDQTLAAWIPLAPSSAMTCGGGYTETKVFADNPAGFGIDDWTAAVFGNTLHAVRRLSDGTFEHRIMDPTAFTWGPGSTLDGPMQSQGTLQGSGLFLAPYGDGLVLVAIGGDGSSLFYTAYGASATTWSGWLPLTTDAPSAGWLSGHAPPTKSATAWVKPAVVWTQPVGASYGIFGLQLL